ncbi:MAG: T9SS type A sorting domain-containing protein [Bacteroidales bacterium]|nr:T9SS type A sorting domain-containing protein [Bacteroidales bacterium]
MKKIYVRLGLISLISLLIVLKAQPQCPPPGPPGNKKFKDIVVVKSTGEMFHFIDANDAIAFAKDNDYVYLPGGIFDIGTINKSIKLIGAGHFTDSTKITRSTWINSSIIIGSGANNVLIEGLYINKNIEFTYPGKAENITIRRCNMDSINFNGGHNAQFINDTLKYNNVIIYNNIIRNSCDIGGVADIIIKGNIFQGPLNYMSKGLVENNIFMYSLTSGKMIEISNVIFKNNIFLIDSTFSRPEYECEEGPCGSYNNIFINNIFTADSLRINLGNGIAKSITNSLYSINTNKLFVKQSGLTYNEKDDYHIISGSPAKNFGDDGTDAGIYGSDQPYKEGAVPYNPHISHISTEGSSPQDTILFVNIKVIAQPIENICQKSPCNFITEYKYWWRNNPAVKTTVKLTKPAEIAYILHPFSISEFYKGKDTINFMFKDTNSLWSVMYSYKIKPKAAFDAIISNNDGKFIVSFTNKSIFAKYYFWNFGDNTPLISLNSPVHQYQKPGDYLVALAAANNFAIDTFKKVITIKGIGSVVPNSAGNKGKVSVYINGGGFKEGSDFYLHREGQDDIFGDSVRFLNSGTLMAIFDFNGKTLGSYDVVVKVPNEEEWVYPNGFNIVETRAPEPWVNISGRQNILLNAWQDYSLNYGNNGNIDALGVPVWIAVPDIDNFEIKFNNITVNHSKYAIDNGLNAGIDTNYNFFRTDTLFGEAFKAKVYSFYIPVIPAGNSFSAKLSIKTSGDCTIMSWTNPPYFQTGPDNDFAACLFNAFNEGIITIPQGSIPTLNCLDSISKKVFNPWSAYYPAEPLKWQSWHWNTLASLKGCNDNLNISDTLTNALVEYALNLSQYSPKIEECDNIFKVLSSNEMSIHIVASLDPNEKTGPAGYSDVNYFKPAKVNPYTIFFENKADATAPAHKAVITDTLDLSRFNIKDFYFSDISFGDTVISPQNGLKEFTADIDLNPAKELIVRINAMLDTVKGVAIWEFLSLDPKTMALTDSIELGFLPPNINKPEGEGSVSFIIGLKDSLNNNDIIKNKAYIYFDYNDPIITNEYINTIDTESPLSAVSALAPFNTDSVFTVSWNGTDNGSGIKYYSVFVTTNDMDTIEWKSKTTDTSAVFNAKPGNFYKFFSIATDNIGNIESKTSFDTETSILTALNPKNNPASTNFNIYPNPSKGAISINYTLNRPSDVSFSIYNILGQKIYSTVNTSNTKGAYKTYISLPDVPGGLYFIYFNTAYSSIAKKLIISK